MEKKQKWITQARRGKAVMAVLLSFLLLFQSNIAFATTGTVSRNETAGEETAVAVSENQPAENEPDESETGMELEENPDDMEGNGLKEDTMEDTVSGQNILEIQAGAIAGPENPVHHCSKEGLDYAEFSYVYFGSYPQGEIRDSGTIAAIDKAIAASGAAAEAGTDVWVNGAKYRRICKSDTNRDEDFDDISTNNGYRYFKWERIKWKVLQNDGKTLFVVADRAIDCKNYNEEKTAVTWETSTIRNWLNTVFYNSAFSSRERGAIIEQTVVNEDNPDYGTEGGNDTRDNVYLLSLREVTNERYGFCSDDRTMSLARRVKASDYAHIRGAYILTAELYLGNCIWWLLRSPGDTSDCAAAVYGLGFTYGVGVVADNGGMCPALHINLSSDLWTETDDGTSGDGGEEITTPPVSNTEKTITKLSVTGPSKKLAAGKKVKLTLNSTPKGADPGAVEWKSSNKKYASVDKNGTVTIKKAGVGKNVTITATARGDSKVKAACRFQIMEHAVKSIKLKAPKKTLKTGKSMTVKATVKTTGKNANKTLKWTSSNKKYATVNSKGKVIAKKAGKGKTVTITAKSTDGSNKKSTVEIKIK